MKIFTKSLTTMFIMLSTGLLSPLAFSKVMSVEFEALGTYGVSDGMYSKGSFKYDDSGVSAIGIVEESGYDLSFVWDGHLFDDSNTIVGLQFYNGEFVAATIGNRCQQYTLCIVDIGVFSLRIRVGDIVGEIPLDIGTIRYSDGSILSYSYDSGLSNGIGTGDAGITSIAPVPLPGAFGLLAMSLLGMLGAKRRGVQGSSVYRRKSIFTPTT